MLFHYFLATIIFGHRARCFEADQTTHINPDYHKAKYLNTTNAMQTTNFTDSKDVNELAFQSFLDRAHSPFTDSLVQRQYCNETRLTNLPTLSEVQGNISSHCLPWDRSCAGNRTASIDFFFEYAKDSLILNPCFRGLNESCTADDQSVLPELGPAKDYLRSPQCVSDLIEYHEPVLHQVASGFPSRGFFCCEDCVAEGANAELYYWMDPRADTSCLHLEAGSRPSSSHHGFTTSYNAGLCSTEMYWACMTSTTGYTKILTTAKLATLGSMTFKFASCNPWNASQCVNRLRDRDLHDGTMESCSMITALPMSTPPSRTIASMLPQNEPHPSILVTDGFTFTYPSIYANITNLTIGDNCGSTVISNTLITFAPGELSTVVNPYESPVSLRAFNSADLPCPPASAMRNNWYDPSLGEPYRPFIVIPDRVKSLFSDHPSCGGSLSLYLLDPPRVLMAASGFVPGLISTGDTAILTTNPTPAAQPPFAHSAPKTADLVSHAPEPWSGSPSQELLSKITDGSSHSGTKKVDEGPNESLPPANLGNRPTRTSASDDSKGDRRSGAYTDGKPFSFDPNGLISGDHPGFKPTLTTPYPFNPGNDDGNKNSKSVTDVILNGESLVNAPNKMETMQDTGAVSTYGKSVFLGTEPSSSPETDSLVSPVRNEFLISKPLTATPTSLLDISRKETSPVLDPGTGISTKEKVVVLPDGQRFLVTGKSLPTPLGTEVLHGSEPDVFFLKNDISLLGTSAVLIAGTRTLALSSLGRAIPSKAGSGASAVSPFTTAHSPEKHHGNISQFRNASSGGFINSNSSLNTTLLPSVFSSTGSKIQARWTSSTRLMVLGSCSLWLLIFWTAF